MLSLRKLSNMVSQTTNIKKNQIEFDFTRLLVEMIKSLVGASASIPAKSTHTMFEFLHDIDHTMQFFSCNHCTYLIVALIEMSLLLLQLQ